MHEANKLSYETGASHILDSDKRDTALVELIVSEMQSDGDAAQYINRLAFKYIHGTQQVRESIDDVLIHVCGWGMETLLIKLGNELREVA